MTTTLAFDTSQQFCSVAISHNGQILAHDSKPMVTGHSEALLPMISQILEQSGLKPADLDRIATITGPGSFTGLRISLATAQAMAFGLGIPLIGINTFSAYKACITTTNNLLVVIDSQKADVYCQLFTPDGKPVKEPVSISPLDVLIYTDTTHFDVTGNGTYKLSLTDHVVHKVSPDDVCIALSLSNEKYHNSNEALYIKAPLPLST